MKRSPSSERSGIAKQVLAECFPKSLSNLWQVGGQIDSKKLHNSIGSYGSRFCEGIKPEDVVALYDSAAFGSGKSGVIVTSSGVVIGDLVKVGQELQQGIYVPFTQLEKSALEDEIALCLRADGTEIRWTSADADVLADFLEEVSRLTRVSEASRGAEALEGVDGDESQRCPFCDFAVRKNDPVCSNCEEHLVKSHVTGALSTIKKALAELATPAPGGDAVVQFGKDAMAAGLGGVFGLHLLREISRDSEQKKALDLAEMVKKLTAARERYEGVLTKAEQGGFLWAETVDVGRLRTMWPKEALRDFVAWSCPLCRLSKDIEGGLDIWLVAPFDRIGHKQRCPLCREQSVCPSLLPQGAVGGFEPRADDVPGEAPRLGARFRPSAASTRRFFLLTVACCVAGLINGLFAGVLGNWAAAWISSSYSMFGTIMDFPIMGLFRLGFWLCYCFVHLFVLMLAAGMVVPLYFAACSISMNKKLPAGQMTRWMILFIGVGCALSGQLVPVLPDEWYVPFSASIQNHPWTFVLPSLVLLAGLGMSAEADAEASVPFCRKCRTWFQTVPCEWAVPASAGLPGKNDELNGLEKFLSEVALADMQETGEDITSHRATQHCHSLRLAQCPCCSQGVVHVAKMRPTLHMGATGASAGILHTAITYLGISAQGGAALKAALHSPVQAPSRPCHDLV